MVFASNTVVGIDVTGYKDLHKSLGKSVGNMSMFNLYCIVELFLRGDDKTFRILN